MKKAVAPCPKPELEQEFALRHRAIDSEAERTRASLDLGKIDMGGEVGLALHGERVGEAMAVDGLQRVPHSGLGMAVVDDEGSQRGLARACCQRGEERGHRRPRLDDGAVGSVDTKRYIRQAIALHYFSSGEGEGAAWRDGDAALAPYAALPHELLHGKGVDELVGKDDERAFRHVLDAFAPLDRRERAFKRRLLHIAHCGARLDQSNGDALQELGNAPPGTERVGHQRAATGTELGNDRLAGLAHRLPDGDGPQAEKLTEDLAHLRRSDEIAGASDRLARGVIAGARVGEAGLHVGRNAQGAFAGNLLLEPRRKRRLLGAGELQLRTHHEARAGTRRARQINHRPTAIMGRE